MRERHTCGDRGTQAMLTVTRTCVQERKSSAQSDRVFPLCHDNHLAHCVQNDWPSKIGITHDFLTCSVEPSTTKPLGVSDVGSVRADWCPYSLTGQFHVAHDGSEQVRAGIARHASGVSGNRRWTVQI